MTSEEYWAQREKEKQDKVDEITDVEVQKIRKAIEDAIEDLENEIYRIYMKYAIDNKMDYYQVLQYLKDDERKEFQRDLQYYIEKYKDSDYVKKYKKELHSLSVRARVKRIEAFIANIKQHASDLEEILNTSTRENLQILYTEGYLRELYNMNANKETTLKQVIPAFNTNLAREIMETPWSGKNYSDKIWDLSGDFAKKLEEKLTQGLIQGKHPDAIAREFRTLGFGKTGNGGIAWRTEALIRTEAAYLIEQAQKTCYRDMNVEMYVFMTAKDRKVCSVCAGINHKEYLVSEAAPGVNYPPMHPICRCTTKPKDPYEDEDESQYDLSYDEWYQKYVQSEIDKIQTEKAKNEMTEQINELTDEEKDVVTRWTGALAQKINHAIRNNLSLDKYRQDMNHLDNALNKGIITKDLLLYRNTDVRYLSGYKGGRFVTEEAVKNLIGKTIINNIYTATSFKHLKLGARNTVIKIRVPKGTPNALYIKSIALDKYKSQEEILFGRELSYIVKDAKIEDGKVYIEAEVLNDD